MAQTIAEKLVQLHLADGPADRPVRAGDFVSVRPDHVMTHDNTAAVMKKFRALGAERMHDPQQPVFALDHDIQNRTAANLAKYREIEDFATAMGVDFYPAGVGIGHQVIIEHGYVTPGSLVVASDSHSNMYGAMGALGTPVVRTDAAAIWATGVFWWQIPRTVLVHLTGKLQAGVSGKDVILVLAGMMGSQILNAVAEFGGPGVSTLTMDARLSIANMSTEWGALAAYFPADHVTLDYLETRRRVLTLRSERRIEQKAIERWRKNTLAPDPGATYAGRIDLDLTEIRPHVAGPDSVQAITPLATIEERRVKIHKAYLLSCVNGRFEDLEAAARVLEGRTVADGVEMYLAAASAEVQQAAEASGAWEILVEAGAKALPPGCGPCIGLGAGLLESGQVGISATNRNFKGRMGARDAQCYLASPEVVAASAVAGTICGPRRFSAAPARPRWTQFPPPLAADEETPIVDGFPATVSGRLVLVPVDNLNTDGIYGKDYTYREDMTPEMMAGVVMENYDPDFATHVGAGDVLIGGYNFGTGSSREQAATALMARGVRLVLAASYSQTFLRNAFNNGFACIACPPLVDRVREILAAEVSAGTRTIIPGDTIEIDFASGTVEYRDEVFAFPALGVVPQQLVVAGGIENKVRDELARS